MTLAGGSTCSFLTFFNFFKLFLTFFYFFFNFFSDKNIYPPKGEIRARKKNSETLVENLSGMMSIKDESLKKSRSQLSQDK